jgi:hypothetical protein
MSYTTGSAVSFAAVKTALIDECVTDGWTNTADSGGYVVLSKSGVFVRVIDAVDKISFRGRTSLDAGNAPNNVNIGDIHIYDGTQINIEYPVSFPLTYHIFTFTNEVFLVIGYGDRYQWAAFGLSTQAGITGTGAFVGASFGNMDTYPYFSILSITSSSGGLSGPFRSPGALFWGTDANNDAVRNSFIHSNIDPSYPWDLGETTNSLSITGIRNITQLLDTQPNAYNSESVLLPIRAYKERTDSKRSQVLEVENARYIRVDNYNNGEVITLGLDKWMVLPWHQKNVPSRNGGTGVNHSGTFGWAIKYEGP